jgi:hypothetical protein
MTFDNDKRTCKISMSTGVFKDTCPGEPGEVDPMLTEGEISEAKEAEDMSYLRESFSQDAPSQDSTSRSCT